MLALILLFPFCLLAFLGFVVFGLFHIAQPDEGKGQAAGLKWVAIGLAFLVPPAVVLLVGR